MRNMENDKNHTVEHIRWVSYTENTFVGNGICRTVYINELQWETWKMKNHTVEHIRWVSYTEKTFVGNGIVEQCISMSYNEKHGKW